MPRLEGEARPEPDPGLAAAAEVDAGGPEPPDEVVPGGGGRGVDGAEGADAPGSAEEVGIPGLEVLEAGEHRLARGADHGQQAVLTDDFDDLGGGTRERERLATVAKVAIIARVVARVATRAGHFRYFLAFSIIKNEFFALFIKLITYFCISPI